MGLERGGRGGGWGGGEVLRVLINDVGVNWGGKGRGGGGIGRILMGLLMSRGA